MDDRINETNLLAIGLPVGYLIAFFQLQWTERNHQNMQSHGSVSGPLFFLIFIDDMPSCIDHCNLHLFADYSLIYHKICCQASIVELQSDLDWTRQMSFNVSECEHMRVTRKSDTPPAPVYNFDSSTLLQVVDIQYPGIHIDSHLLIDKHIQEICRKASKLFTYAHEELEESQTKDSYHSLQDHLSTSPGICIP